MKLHEPTFGEEEIAAAVEVLRSTQVTQGAKVRDFERNFWPGGHAVACNSGSSANLLAISALKAAGWLDHGREIIVPALSWSTTVFPIIQLGFVPVFVDCDLDTLNIDTSQLESAISPETVAIMPVHVYGNPCDMTSLLLLKNNGIRLIEDCCEAMGATWLGGKVGSYGDVATFSTYFSHHITTLEGGLVIADQPELIDLLRIQRSHGWTRDGLHHTDYPDIDPRFTFVELGYNLRMTEVQAAIGLTQLPKLDTIVGSRYATHKALREALSHIPWLRFQKETPSGKSSCFGFTMIMEDDAPFGTFGTRKHLEFCGIETRPIICGNMALQPVMQKYEHRCVGNLPNATKVMKDGFSIGCHQDVTLADVDRVRSAFDDLLKEYSNRGVA